MTPWTITYQAPWSMGFSRQEYWSGLPFPSPGDLPNPGIEPGSPTWQADSLSSEPPGEPRREQNIPPPLPLTGKSRWHCFLSQECFPKVMFSSLFVTAFQRNSLDSRDRWGGVDGDRVLTWPEGLGCGLGT